MNEQISALLDDEIAVEDAGHLITAVQFNRQAGEAWSHYHLIGDAMRGTVLFSTDFKQNLMQKIELEATVLSPNAALMNLSEEREQQVAAKSKLPAVWSVAASFAAVMVVGWMVMHQQTQSGSDLVAVAIAQVQTLPAEYLMAHQASAPSPSSYYIQSVNYSE